MIDIIYPLRHAGSHWDNNELKYSLRSVEKHLTGVRNIWVIGERPKWINPANLNHRFHVDESIFPARNIYLKIKSMCQHPEISENFLFMNDDHFFTHDFVASEIPYYYTGDLREIKNNTTYQETINNTIRTLENRNRLTLNFDTHTPIIYNKEKFLKTTSEYFWTKDHAYCIKSIYCNTLKIEGVNIEDGKFRNPKGDEQLDHWLSKHKIFSIEDTAINRDLEKRFETLYPTKSKYEL